MTEIASISIGVKAPVGIALDDLARAIRCGIDDDQQLEIGEGLLQNGVDRGGEKALVVVRSQKNRYPWRHDQYATATLARRQRTGDEILSLT